MARTSATTVPKSTRQDMVLLSQPLGLKIDRAVKRGRGRVRRRRTTRGRGQAPGPIMDRAILLHRLKR